MPGRRFHTRFAKMHLDASYANRVAFVELLAKHTTRGSSWGAATLMRAVSSKQNAPHLKQLQIWLQGSEKIVFLGSALLRDSRIRESLGIQNPTGRNVIEHTHLSRISNKNLGQLRKKILRLGG